MMPEGVSVEAWAIATAKAQGDRAYLGNLVAQGRAFRVRHPKALVLPARPGAVNLAIRPKRKRRK